MGDGLWTDWSLCFVVFCIVRCGIRFFFFLSFFCIDVVIISRNEGSCIFLTINLKSFARFVYFQFFHQILVDRSSLDFENIITKISSPMSVDESL